MNRPVRTRMQGGVGRAGEKPALTRLGSLPQKIMEIQVDRQSSVTKYLGFLTVK